MLKCGGSFHCAGTAFCEMVSFSAQVTLGLAFGEWCFWGVGCGCDIGIGVSGCCIEAVFRDKSQLK